jgi:hypothetical protein
MDKLFVTIAQRKKDPYRTRITMGGNLINYPDDCGTPTANLLTVKIMINSVISMPNAKFMTIDIKDFYLMTPMDQYKYFCMKLELFPPNIIDEYGLRDKVDADGNVFCKVQHGMYGHSRHHSARPPHQATQQSRVSTEQDHARVLAT